MQKMIFIFPGIGSHYVGMGKDFYDKYSIVRDTFEEAGDILEKDYTKMCFSSMEGEELENLENSQSALLVVSIASYKVYMEEIGITPDYCMGHSLGEYSALCCAGVIRFSDALRLVKQRAIIIKNAASLLDGTIMRVTNQDTKIVEKICNDLSKEGESVFISTYDSPHQSSISGYRQSVIRAAKKMEKEGANVSPLKMNGPLHSPLMKEAANEMKTILKQYKYKDPVFPVLANQNARPYKDGQSVIDNLSLQLISPIRWDASINYLIKQGAKTVVEIGPKNGSKFSMEKNSGEIRTFVLDNDNDLKNLKEELILGKEEFLQVIARCLGIAASTRNRNENNEEYIEKVIKPYRRIESLYETLKSNGKYPTEEQVKESIQLLRCILDAKKVPQQEQEQRLNHIFEEKMLKFGSVSVE